MTAVTSFTAPPRRGVESVDKVFRPHVQRNCIGISSVLSREHMKTLAYLKPSVHLVPGRRPQ